MLKACHKEFIISKLPHLIRKYQLFKRGGLLLFRASGFTDTPDYAGTPDAFLPSHRGDDVNFFFQVSSSSSSLPSGSARLGSARNGRLAARKWLHVILSAWQYRPTSEMFYLLSSACLGKGAKNLPPPPAFLWQHVGAGDPCNEMYGSVDTALQPFNAVH